MQINDISLSLGIKKKGYEYEDCSDNVSYYILASYPFNLERNKYAFEIFPKKLEEDF